MNNNDQHSACSDDEDYSLPHVAPTLYRLTKPIDANLA